MKNRNRLGTTWWTTRPRLARSNAVLMVAALFAIITVLTMGVRACSGRTSDAAAQPIPTTRTTVSSPPPVPTSTPAPLPRTTPAPVPRTTPAPVPKAVPLAPFVPGAPLARSVPVRLQIPSISVDSALMNLGLRSDGSIEVPPSGFPAGWYTGGPTPGQLGPAVIAGHIDWGGPGVFYNLHNLKPGDRVIVTRADGSRPVFRIMRIAQYPKTQFPTKLVYGNLDHAGLRLITCGGTFNSATGHYEDDIIAFADLTAS